MCIRDSSGTLTVAFSDPAMTLDVGAAAKGYTAVQAGQAARERGLTHALLNMGGNVYTCLLYTSRCV